MGKTCPCMQGFKYFSSVPVLHYLQAKLFIKIQGCHFQPIADDFHRLISHFASVTFLKLQVENLFLMLFLGSKGLSIPNLIGNMSISIGYLKS